MKEQASQFSIGKALALLAALAALVALLFLTPTVRARWRVNLFMRDLARAWTAESLIPNQDACPPVPSRLAMGMAAALAQAGDDDPHQLLHQGELACVQGELDRAAQAWGRAVDRTPSPPVENLFAAIAFFSKREIIDSAYRKAIGVYGYQQGGRSEKDDKLIQAVDWYEFSFAYVPTGKTARKLEALYRKLGQDVAARDVWIRLQSAFTPDSPEYWWAVGRMAEQQQDWAKAAEAYRSAAQVSETDKEALSFRLREGSMWLRAKRYEEAEQAYREAIRLAPEKPGGYLGLGHVYRQQERYDEAIAAYKKAQETSPKDYRPLYYMGLTIWAKNHSDEALSYFDQALALKPGNSTVLYNKANVLDKLKRRSEAIDVLSQAIVHHSNPPESWQKLLARWKRYPDYAQDPDRWWERGQAAEKEKDWARAAAIYAEGAGKAQPPDDYRLLEREAVMYRYLQAWDKAAAIYEDLVQRYPEKINAYLGLGETYRAQGRYEEAASWFQRARELLPDDYRPPYYLGVTALNAHEYEKALAYLEESLALKPEHVYTLYSKARALKALGRNDEAIEALARAIDLHSHPPESWKDLLAEWRVELEQ